GGRRLDEISAAMKACFLWRVDCAQPHSLVLAGNTLFAGGNDEVAAYSTADGKQIWTGKVNGAALGLAVAHGRLLVSTHKGTIHCFTTE
ncbi:MAG: PQQ-binding-like beta-propeller repeat protein, partial [Limisphaerales bacterium]